MIWFLTLILFICVICAIQKHRSEDFIPAHKNVPLEQPPQPARLQSKQNIPSLPEKTADTKWLFELGF
jgi:hypothetical protein